MKSRNNFNSITSMLGTFITSILVLYYQIGKAHGFGTQLFPIDGYIAIDEPIIFNRFKPSETLNVNKIKHFRNLETSLMCQLLGMNCANPTDFSFSFKGFKLRGGCTDVHGDGWGIAFYEGRGMRIFHDSLPCATSPIAQLVSDQSMRTLNMIAHIRYATAGEVSLENVHPFQREMVSMNVCIVIVSIGWLFHKFNLFQDAVLY
mmetsp:Transcript_13950/g.19964  ORF Transcript_13950/g.19964 Transcript_13950/m.19964 type:complete len:204 (-) Transcript_13950:1006-1617(-)